MGRVTSFSLGEHFTSFVESQVAEGRYNDASDVMRAAPRLLEEREARIGALRAALIEGEDCGPSTRFDFEAFIARKQKRKSKAPFAVAVTFMDRVFDEVERRAPRMDFSDACAVVLASVYDRAFVLTTDFRDLSAYGISFAYPGAHFIPEHLGVPT